MKRIRCISIYIFLLFLGAVSLILINFNFLGWRQLSSTFFSWGTAGERNSVTDKTIRYSIEQVIDGDTIKIYGLTDSIRLIGIDAPENNDRRPAIRCLANLATQHLKDLVEGHEVYLVSDIENRDKYGRFLRYVYRADSTFINLTMIEHGYAQILSIPPNIRFAPLFLAAREEAKNNNRGLWYDKICHTVD